jgi:AcrR family transcriptional regulator
VAIASPVERPRSDLSLRERKKRETRATLIGSALRLVAERGLESVTVEEISAAANVSVRTFFNYFRNKEDAVTGGGVMAGERLTRVLDEAPANVSVLAAVRSGMLAEAEAIEKDPAELLLVLTIAERTPSLKPQLVASGEAVLHDLAAAVGRRSGLDPSTHGYPGLVAAVTGAAFRHAVFRWHDAGAVQPLTEVLSEALGALADGLPEPT